MAEETEATIGRPCEFTQEIADTICEKIACGESVRAICSEESMPAMSTVFRWLSLYQQFSEQYARAREVQAETFYDELLAISDDGHNDWMEKNFGEETAWVVNGEALQRSKLRVDTRKWAMSKMLPKKYGEKIQQEVTGSLGVSLINSIPRPER